MDIEMFRHYCLSLPGTTEDVKWEENLCFLIENKIYVIYSLTKGSFAIKCDVEEFQELVSRDGITQAYHMAKGSWIGIADLEVLPWNELKKRVAESRGIILSKLPKKIQAKYTE
ncbi:MmcQ/YjbR family DNA-binding protein [Pedobacter antarcticus]|uniref:MmcQ-like protein n=2 Tax=Pedobacter antarcticus TaxID=34086 RepID=A0A081PEH6_9SPHI|nr:MmcQ/YjbR family DNA-binding protein [Pedobacter antarcticus]KEQ29099.1 hypothetical protein N180_09635 [Pedobacter antarcticus 4BY]SDM38453.1 Predicted DNA-binding protein, MmcQ/YjbR family [Pedobacter antarcticus]SFE94069.1 Predicted DNA-binding protein, MmcQ/YjbR family [Pedobacter antarcticus]